MYFESQVIKFGNKNISAKFTYLFFTDIFILFIFTKPILAY